MKTTSTIFATVAMGLALSGCQSLFGQHRASLDSAQAPELAQGEVAVNPALDQGRQLLKAGRIAQAVELLRIAQRDPASMAEASNALGVAYAKLGRHDLADRYFRMALSLQPGDQRFAANMLRLQRDFEMATRRNEEAQQLALRAAEEKRLAEARAAQPGSIQRMSRGEVHISTQAAPSAVAPQVKVLAMRSPNSDEAKKASALPADNSPEAQAAAPAKPKSYPVTIDFKRKQMGNGVTVGAPPSDRQYPVRVYIGA